MLDAESKPDVNLLWVGLMIEGGLILIALFLGWLGVFDWDQPLDEMDWGTLRITFVWGILATLPMLGYLAVFHYWRPRFFEPMERFVDLKMKPLFQRTTILELLILSLLAGFGEELFFRWCLQGGISSLLSPVLGGPLAIAVGIAVASLIFGGCHWVNASYGITTTIVGAYLGMTMVWSGTWLVPAIAHALFDFIALIYIARTPVRGRL